MCLCRVVLTLVQPHVLCSGNIACGHVLTPLLRIFMMLELFVFKVKGSTFFHVIIRHLVTWMFCEYVSSIVFEVKLQKA